MDYFTSIGASVTFGTLGLGMYVVLNTKEFRFIAYLE